jgi:CBS domain-containing protein
MARHIITDLVSTKRIEIIDAGLPIHAARTLLDTPGLDALLVLTETGPCGVVRRATLEASGPTEVGVPVAAVMTLVGPAIRGDMDAMQAIRVMQGCGRNDLPVMDGGGKILSLVSVTDLLMVLDYSLCEDLVA